MSYGRFQRHTDIGVFTKLTNSYCLVPQEGIKLWYRNLQHELGETPIIQTNISGCRIIGRITAGNKHGLLVPNCIDENELLHLRNSLPDNVKIKCIEDKLSALGNVIACNDRIALVHPDLDKETEEIIGDVLNVEVFRQCVGKKDLVGAYSVLSNFGCVVHPGTKIQERNDLSLLLDVPVVVSTVNDGSELLGAGCAVSNGTLLFGWRTTLKERTTINNALKNW